VIVLRHVRIFLSSPSDVNDERNLARRVVQAQLPVDPSLRGKVSFDIVSHDDPAASIPMPANQTPQDAISRGLPKPSQCDFLVMVLWSRLGTPLPAEYRKPNGERYYSGTEWEFEDASNADNPPEILIYHRSEEVILTMNDPEREEKIKQWEDLKKFLGQFKNPDGSLSGSVKQYASPSEFAEVLSSTLAVRALRLEHCGGLSRVDPEGGLRCDAIESLVER